MVAEDAGFGVGGHVDGADVFYAGGVGGHEFFPESALAGFYVEAVDAGGQLAGLIDVERVAVGGPGDGLLAGIEAGD